MIIRQCILVLLAIFMIMGCVGAVSATNIDSVIISGITIPIAGAEPINSIPTVSPTANISTVNSITWEKDDGTSVGATFDYATIYKANFTVSAAENDLFVVNTQVSASDSTSRVLSLEEDGKKARIIITYPVTESRTSTNVSSVSVTGISAPIAGETPVSSASVISYPPGKVVATTTVSWEYENGTGVTGNFGYGTAYKANITLSAEGGYTFNSSTTFNVVNASDSSPDLKSECTKAVITCTYPATLAAPSTTKNITSVDITLTSPQTGVSPSRSVSAVSSPMDGVGIPVLTWSSSPDVFAGDTYYTASVVIPVADGHIFTSSTTAKINGHTGTIKSRSSTSMTVNYTFEKTSSSLLPTITLSTNVTSGTLPLTVKFTYAVENSTSTTWTYGDGSSETLQYLGSHLTHTYTTAGTYTANLTAMNANGTVYKSVNITVNKVGLNAAFTASPGSGTAPLKVWFTDTSAGSPTTWLWDFGGLGSSTLKNPSFTFTTAGNYIVKLTVIDGTGAADIYSKVITVNAPVITSTSTPAPTDTSSSLSMSYGTGNITSLIPAPLDVIKEFIRLFYTLLDMENYAGLSNQTNTV